MTVANRTPALHLHSNIPVVEVEGEWDEATGSGVAELVLRLVRAGHLEIIVNLKRMTGCDPAEGLWLKCLEQVACVIGSHCGRLDIVGSAEQVRRCLDRPAHSRLLWATSEEEAIAHIKGLPIYRSGPILSMRLSR